MEHLVNVPFPVDEVHRAIADPVRLRRCVPGLQVAAGDSGGAAEEVAGRLKLRIAGSTITYRGTARVSDRKTGVRVEARGEEVRGGGSVKATLRMVAEAAPEGGGTMLRLIGSVEAEGRLAEAEPKAAEAAARRLLDGFAGELSAELERGAGSADGGAESGPVAEESAGAAESAAAGASAAGEPEAGEESAEGTSASDASGAGASAADATGPDVSAAEDAETAAEPEAGAEPEPEPAAASEPFTEDDLADGAPAPDEAPVNGRRTMIGRSAEEVDHAPPRGRYAPVPSLVTAPVRAIRRWAAPAAAAVVASVVVVGRVLRRRRGK